MLIIMTSFLILLTTSKDFFFFSSYTDYSLLSYSLIFVCIMLFMTFFFLKNDNTTQWGDSVSNFLLVGLVVLNMLCYVFNSSFFFILGLELSVLPMAFSILYLSKDKDKFYSVSFMVLTNMVGSIPAIISVSKIFNEDLFFSSISLNSFSFSSMFMFICTILVFLSKMPMFFFHFWLTKAHVSAFGTCSMLLASLMLKLSTVGMLKFLKLFPLSSFNLISFFSSVSLYSSMIFCLIMIRFFDLKFLVASSSVIHMSYIAPSLLVYSSEGIMGSMMMMVGHGVVSCYLFYIVSDIYEAQQSRSLDLIKGLESSDKTFAMMLIFWLVINLGFPPFINFVSEILFLNMFMNLSVSCCIIFSLTFILSVIFTILSVTKICYKKKLFLQNSFNSKTILTSIFYTMGLLVCSFMF